MESRMNEEKIDALLKWANTANISSKVTSLQELSNAKLLMEIVYLIDKDFQVEESTSLDDNAKWLAKIIKYLENFYHQSLGDFVDQCNITYSQDNLEIGKVLSLLLCCAVQGENVSECIEKITSLEENLQFQLKTIIEAVLKDLDNGKIDSANVTKVLCQSESFRDFQSMNDEYQSSPIIMSPISLYNSPIKALMASPQMQSRQSQMTISKLYKRLNQFQIQINGLQRTVSDLEQELEDKRKQIEQRELKIKSLSKEVAKVPALEEEVESLTRFETELNDVNRKCNRLRKSTEELMKYKEQFLKLEKDYSDLFAEKEREKLGFEKCLKELKDEHKEELQCIQSLLDNSNQKCDQFRIQLQEASTAEEMMKKQAREEQDLYAKEIEKLKKTLAESKTSRDKLCLKNDQDVLRHIAREAELKQCFREQEATLQTLIDQTQLQNCELKRNMEQLQIDFNKEKDVKTDLESSLALSRAKLSEAVGKYERLQSDFITLGNESKNTINKILEEKDLINEASKKAREDRDLEILELRNSKEELEERSRCLVDELEELKQKRRETLTYQENLKSKMDAFLKEKNSLMAENILLKKRSVEEDNLALELKHLQDVSETFMAKNAALLKENSSLNDKVEELQQLSKNFEVLQSSLSLANEEKMSVVKDVAIKEKRISELERLSTNLEESVNDVKEQLQSLEEKHSVVEKKAQEVDSLHEEIAHLNNSLRISNEEKHSLLEKNLSLNVEIVKFKKLKEEHTALQNHFQTINEGELLLMKENADLKEKVDQSESLSDEFANLQQSLMVSNEEKVSLQEKVTSLKDEIVKLETRNEEHKEFRRHFEALNEENVVLMKENAYLKGNMEQTETLSNERANLHRSLDVANKENVSLKERNSSLKDEIEKLEKISEEHQVLKSHFEALNEEKLVLLKENNDLEEKMTHTESLTSECKVLHQAFNVANKENVLLKEENSSTKDEILKRKKISEERKVLQSHFEALNEQKLLLMKEDTDLKGKLTSKESLSSECVHLRQSLDMANEENVSLKERNSSLKDEIVKLETLSEEHRVLQRHFEALDEAKLLLTKENADLKVKMTHTESPSSECQVLRQSSNVASEEKVSLAEENALLKGELNHVKESYNPLQCEKEISFMNEKLSSYQDCPPVKTLDNETSHQLVSNYNVESNVNEHESLISKHEEIMRKFKVACCTQSNAKSAASDFDVSKIEADLRECYATIVDQYVKYKTKRHDHEDSLEVKPNIKEEKMVKLVECPKLSPKEETNLQIQELQNKMFLLEKENKNLKELQEKCREEFLNKKTKVAELTKNVRHSEEMKRESNNNNVDLELEILSLRDQVKKLQDEKIKLADYVSHVEKKVLDFENKLVEEEFISKRLAVEVRSLEAQLAYADRQLRQKLDSKDSERQRRGNYKINPEIRRTEMAGNHCKMVAVSEDSAVTEDSAVADDSTVTDDSIICEVSLASENKEFSSDKKQEEVKKTNMLGEQEEVLKRLRRRSAVYSKKSSKRSEIVDKRRSTIGTESFVVGQFSNTVADEPEDHSYDWERIMELKKRNSTCLPHMRSSYPVETQVRLKEEVEEEELKAGYSVTTTSHSRKRLRDNVSDSSIFTTSDVNGRCLPRSKSEDAFGKFFTEKMTVKLNSLKSNEHGNIRSLTSFVEQVSENAENNDHCNRRESIAFKVDITPAKKSRMSLGPRESRAAEKKENGRSKNKVKPQSLKKLTLQRTQNTTKDDKRPLRTKRSNFAV